MAGYYSYIRGYDSYITPDDLYTKRGYDWSMKMYLDGQLWDANEMHTPALHVETRRSFAFSRGVFGIKFRATGGDETYSGTVSGRLKCRLSVGSWVYGQVGESGTPVWRNTNNQESTYFYIEVGDKSKIGSYCKEGETLQKIPIPVIGKGVEGYNIKTPTSTVLAGKVKFDIINYFRTPSNPHNVNTPIELEIHFAHYDTELQDENNTYKRDINSTMLEEYEISSNLCTMCNKNPFTDHSVFTSGGTYLREVTIEDGQDGQEEIIENNTMWRAYNHYSLPRKVLTIKVRYNNAKTYTPNQRVTYQSKDYAILSADYDWRDSEVKLTLIELNS